MHSKVFIKIILSYLFLHFTNSICGQTTFDVDAEFKNATVLAFSGKRVEARLLARKILEVTPNYTEARTLVGRTYAWDGKYDSARIELELALSFNEKNEDATNALIDLELWSHNYKAALDLSNKALKDINPTSEDFLLKKARAQAQLGNHREGYTTLQELLKINPKNEMALSDAKAAIRQSWMNSVGVTYDYDRFTNSFSPWHGVSAYYARRIKGFGKIIGRINYASRFDKSGTQYEIDLYPKLTKKMYSYINFGYSNADIFPDFRFGVSIYRSLPKKFEAEIGIRYLKYSESTVIYTGSISKYINNLWFSLRPSFIAGGNVENSRSLALITKYYLKDPDNYFTVTLAKGLVTDEFTRDITLLQTGDLGSTNRAKLGFQHRFLSRYIFNAGIGYGSSEYKKDMFRYNYNFSIGIETSF